MSLIGKPDRFQELLAAQVRNEFTASQQYVALAVWFDSQDLPRLAARFYRQALEERSHAMMIIQYLLDNALPVSVPGVNDVRNDFSSVHEAVEVALSQERRVTDEITALARSARADGDYLGEQFVHWFLREQVEEVAAMSTLLTVVGRASDVMMAHQCGVPQARIGSCRRHEQRIDRRLPRVQRDARYEAQP